jgi:metal-responsive CopG/Arc/MetJ family transcriptional regulator
MKIVQMTLDEELIQAVDKVTRRLRTTRSAFTREALREALLKQNIKRLEAQHRAGYQKRPVAKDEVSVWEDEQAWGEK